MLLEAISLSLRSARREYRRPLSEPCCGFPGCLLGPGGVARMSPWSPALDNGQDPTDQDSRTSFSDKRPPESSPQEVSTRWAPRSLERRVRWRTDQGTPGEQERVARQLGPPQER